MFSFEASLNTPDSSQWAGPTATLIKMQHKDCHKMPAVHMSATGRQCCCKSGGTER